MMSKIKVHWQVDDGCVGNRPQYTTIETGDLAEPEFWAELSLQEKESLISAWIQKEEDLSLEALAAISLI